MTKILDSRPAARRPPRVHARRLQRPDEGRRHHRRHADHRVAADASSYALDQGATVVLASHLGRPKGKPAPEFSLKPVAARLSAAARARGGVRRRLHRRAGPGGDRRARRRRADRAWCCSRTCASTPRKRRTTTAFATALADAGRRLRQRRLRRRAPRARVGGRHRRRTSRAAGAGLLMEKELRYLGMALGDPERPFVAHPRRRQGVGQDRGHREPPRHGRSPADRRRDGLHVLQGAGPAGRQVAGRGRQAGRGARHHRARQGAAASS